MVEPRDIVIPAVDGYELSATVFDLPPGSDAAEGGSSPVPPQGGTIGDGDEVRVGIGGRRVVVISSATAVPRGLYRRFATFLADRGYTVVTYDYRGIGESAPANLRGFDATMVDWALLDMTGVLAWVRTELKPESLFLMGHSVGGQVAGLMEDTTDIDGMVTFCSQSAHWRLQGGEQKYVTWFAGYVLLPALPVVTGYGPWSWFGPGEDIPKGVAQQWARWIRKRRYLLDDPTLPLDRYDQFTAPVLAYSFDDDKWGTKEAVDALMIGAYPSVERRHIVPADEGIDQIGHMGFFKQDSSSLWPPVADWLDAH